MRHSLLFLSCTALTFISCAPAKQISTIAGTDLGQKEMERFILHQMDSLKIPSLSIAVINKSEIVYHHTFGVTSLNTGIPANSQSLFDAASLTKTVFAYFVMKMADNKILDLDTPLYKYLPHPDIQDDERYKLITAKMVLSHSSGFPNWRFLNKGNKLDIKFTPGTDFNYSGEGYEYLANVLAHLNHTSKDSLGILMQERIFKPLQMENSSMVWNDMTESRRVDGHIDGKVAGGYGITKERPGFYASYSLQTEAMDYARFLIILMRGQGLSQESFRRMFDIQIRSKDKGKIWGLGIEIQELDNGKLLYKHGGFNNNFSSGYLFSRDTQTGYVFFTNNDSGYKLNDILQAYFLR